MMPFQTQATEGVMQISRDNAISMLRSVDRQVKDQLKTPNKGSGSDTVELSSSQGTLSAGYVKLQQEMSDQLAPLRELIGDNAGQQKGLTGLADAGNEDAVRQRAQELLDGYFNVENTGNRIFDFAFSHYKGGDREKFAREMQGHIHKGFAEAEKLMGGLADISVKTRDYIDKRVDDFIEEGKSKPEEAAKGEAEAAEAKSAAKDGAPPPKATLADLRAQYGDRLEIPEL